MAQPDNDMAFYSEPDEPKEEAAPKEDGEQESMEGETTLIPKSMFAGKETKPGDEFYFKVVHVYEDEVEVEYGTGDSEKGSAREKMHASMSKYADGGGMEEGE